MTAQLNFDIYGFKFQIQSGDYDLSLMKITKDFGFFTSKTDSCPKLKIKITKVDKFSTDGLKLFTTSMCEVRQLSYRRRQLVYRIENKIMASLCDNTGSTIRDCILSTENIEIADDILYFYINSVCGEYLDSKGLMRIHALAGRIKDKTFLVYGRSGFGKSTLALELIQTEAFTIYGDEIVLFDLNTKQLRPFPIRIGASDELPDNYLNSKFSYFFKTKKMVDLPVAKISTPAGLNEIFIIEKTGPFSLYKFNFDIFGGIGLIQMLEFFLRLNNLLTLLKVLKNRVQLILFLQNISFKKIQFNESMEIKLIKLGKL